MIDLTNVDSLIFDMGGVIIDLDLKECFDRIAEFGLDSHMDVATLSTDRDDDGGAIFHKVFHKYQKGLVTTQQFLDVVRSKCDRPVSDQEALDAWNSMIVDIPKARLEMLCRLRKMGKKVFLLSNINDAHWQITLHKFILGRGYTVEQCCDHAFLSFEMGLEKPDPKIFGEVIRQTGVDPSRTVYFDDVLENVETARRLGLMARQVDNGTEEISGLM